MVILMFSEDPGTSRTGWPSRSTRALSSVARNPSRRAWAWASRKRSARNAWGVWAAQSRPRSGVSTSQPSRSATLIVSVTGTATTAPPDSAASHHRSPHHGRRNEGARAIVYQEKIGLRAGVEEARVDRGLAILAPRDHGIHRQTEGVQDLTPAALFVARRNHQDEGVQALRGPQGLQRAGEEWHPCQGEILLGHSPRHPGPTPGRRHDGGDVHPHVPHKENPKPPAPGPLRPQPSHACARAPGTGIWDFGWFRRPPPLPSGARRSCARPWSAAPT